VWPNTRVEAAKCVVPLAAFVTPAKKLPDMPVRAPDLLTAHQRLT